jgi:phage gp16-like protein
MSAVDAKALRRAELAKIHVLKSQLGLDDSTYRAVLSEVAGVDSSADCDARGRRAVLEHFKALGVRLKTRGRPHNLRDEPSLRKIEAYLAEAKRPWSYADSLAKRMYGIEKVAWLREPAHLRGVIAALHRDAVRHGRRTS